MDPVQDPLRDFDWAAHWRRLVEARAAPQDGAFWDRRAASFAFSMEKQENPLVELLAPFLEPHKTLIDVGAGTGRQAVAMADRLDWVTAVEPSEGMRGQIPSRSNLTVVASTWEEADVAPADFVLMSHVLYFVADIVPFLDKGEAHARERVFVFMRDAPHVLASSRLREELSGEPRPREPWVYDLVSLLRWRGRHPDVVMTRYPVVFRWRDFETAVADVHDQLGEVWQEAAGRAWLEGHLQREPDGTCLYDGGAVTSGVVHWQPPA